MQAQREKQSDVVVAFPTERTRLRAVRALPEIFAPVSAPHRRSTVVPVRCGHAAKRAAVLVKVRRLNAEIQALTNPRGTANDMKCLPLALMARADRGSWTVISMKNDWKRIFHW